MGSNESSSDKANSNATDNSAPLTDDMSATIALEIQATLNHLQSLRFKMTEDAYVAQKKKMEELKLKIMEFYKFTQINDAIIKRLSNEKTELKDALDKSESVLNEYKNKHTNCAKEKATYNQKEQELSEKISQLQFDVSKAKDSRRKIEKLLKTHTLKCESQEVEIRKLQNSLETARYDIRIQRELTQKIESELHKQQIQKNSQEYVLRQQRQQLERDLDESNRKLTRERATNIQQAESLTVTKQLSENLRSQLDRDLEDKAQQEKDMLRLKVEIDQLQNALTKTKINLGKSRNDVRQKEVLNKKMKTDLKDKQEKIDGYVKQLEIQQWEIEKEDETKLNKLCGDFVSVYKYTNEENRKYEEIIIDLKSELKLSNRKLQAEEIVKKEIQGKLFLLENSFNSLKSFCNKDVKELKKRIMNKNVKKSEHVENKFPEKYTERSSTSSENKPTHSNQASASDKNQQDSNWLKKEFCANQKEEMAELQKELETIVTDI